MSKLKANVRSKKDKAGTEYWEATVELANLRPTKLCKADGSTNFSNRAVAVTTARNLAKRLGLEIDLNEPASSTSAKTVKKAAKKSTTAASRKTTKEAKQDKPSEGNPPWLNEN